MQHLTSLVPLLISMALCACGARSSLREEMLGESPDGASMACRDTCRGALEEGGDVCGDSDSRAAIELSDLFDCACGSGDVCADACASSLCSGAAVSYGVDGGPGDACWNCISLRCHAPFLACAN